MYLGVSAKRELTMLGVVKFDTSDKSACRHTLPFKYLPRLIVIEMTNNCALWLNVSPPKGGVSTISPRTLITGVKFDYTKNCKLPFGSYAQVHEEPLPSNSQVARTVGG